MTFWEILDSNLFQTVAVLVGAGVAWSVYLFGKRRMVKNIARILVLQIRNIEEAISYLKSECISTNQIINETQMHYSKIVYDDNQWMKNRYLIVKELKQNEFETIDHFYSIATEIKEQQLYIRNKIIQLLEYKGMHYYNAIYTQISDIAIKETGDIAADKELHEIAKTRIIAIRDIYNNPAFTIPTFIPLEFGLGLSKTLSRYKCVTDGVAYKRLLKISNRWF